MRSANAELLEDRLLGVGRLASADGSAHHQHFQRMMTAPGTMRDLSDAAHFLCLLHGRHPGVFDHALAAAQPGNEHDWLEATAEAFVTERSFLVRLAAITGPLPSTPGHAASEAAAGTQHRALSALSQSTRAGCATGAAIALALEWYTLRDLLDATSVRASMMPPELKLPSLDQAYALIATLSADPRTERAMLFGAQQLYAQHHAMWDLLEARASARDRI